MNITLNGDYATRNGRKVSVRLIDLAFRTFPVHAVTEAGQTYAYTQSGSFHGDGTESPHDIVAEWQGEPGRDADPKEFAQEILSTDKAILDRLSAGPALLNWSETASAGYAPLAAVLQEAYDQAARGKGRDRHDNGEPFVDQRAMSIGRKVGPGFPLGQSLKKTEEAATMIGKGQPDAAIRELLGAINYAASAIMLIREQNTGA